MEGEQQEQEQHALAMKNCERPVHKRAIKAWDAHPDVVARWIRYLRAHQVPGVGMRSVCSLVGDPCRLIPLFLSGR